jgi:predicted enzyme related to lactoylglutathione lyase
VTPNPVVHLELHTGNLARAIAFYSRLAGWRTKRIAAYQAVDWAGEIGGGVVECATERASWLPYVEVAGVDAATDRAVALGATVLLAPREGPAGWRSVVRVPDGAELGLWQPKT